MVAARGGDRDQDPESGPLALGGADHLLAASSERREGHLLLAPRREMANSKQCPPTCV